MTARLAMRGVEIIKAWAEEVGSGDSGYVRTGYMMTADAERLPALEDNVARLVSWGLDTRVVSPGEIAEIEPLLSLDGVAGGAYEPDGGFADAQKMTLSWLAAGLLHGVLPMVGARVTWIRVAGGRVRGLDTDRGPVEAGVVVNAAGGWGGALSRSAGVELPISLRRVQVAFVRQPADRPQARLTFSDMVSNLVLRPDRAGIALVVAYQAEQLLAGRDDCEREIDDVYESSVRSALRERMPSYVEAEWLGGFAGAFDYARLEPDPRLGAGCRGPLPRPRRLGARLQARSLDRGGRRRRDPRPRAAHRRARARRGPLRARRAPAPRLRPECASLTVRASP